MERREVDSQERSNSPIAENKTDTRGALVVQEGGRQAPGREGGEGAGLAKVQTRVGAFVWGRKGEERFGLLGKVVSYHGRNLEFLQGHGLGDVSVSL